MSSVCKTTTTRLGRCRGTGTCGKARGCHADGLRDGTGHVRKRPLNFIAGNSKISLGTENPREPCDSTGESRLSEACHSAGFSVTIRWPGVCLPPPPPPPLRPWLRNKLAGTPMADLSSTTGRAWAGYYTVLGSGARDPLIFLELRSTPPPLGSDADADADWKSDCVYFCGEGHNGVGTFMVMGVCDARTGAVSAIKRYSSHWWEWRGMVTPFGMTRMWGWLERRLVVDLDAGMEPDHNKTTRLKAPS